jgi:hypothetical protein
MNSTGQNNEKTGYLVIVLLVVGLTAFSNSMKELAQIHELTVDAGRLIAQWSNDIAPAEIPQIPAIPQVPETLQAPQVVARINRCQSKQSAPSVELPWLSHEQESASEPAPTQKRTVEKVERRVVRIGPSEDDFARLNKLRRLEIKFNARDREILLKTLNRSISLRIAS